MVEGRGEEVEDLGGGSIGANGGEKEGGSEDLGRGSIRANGGEEGGSEDLGGGASEPMVERREEVRTWEGEHQR